MVHMMKFVCLLFTVALMVAKSSVWAAPYSAKHSIDMSQAKRDLRDRFMELIGKRSIHSFSV
jgi:hypothetical protein